MKRYLLIGVGYQQLAIPYSTGEQLASIVSLLADARPVDSKGYGDEQRFVPTSNEPLQMQFIEANKVTIGDDLATLKAQLEDVTKQQAQYSKYWTDERAKTSKLEKELAALKGAAAPNPVPAETGADDVAF